MGVRMLRNRCDWFGVSSHSQLLVWHEQNFYILNSLTTILANIKLCKINQKNKNFKLNINEFPVDCWQISARSLSFSHAHSHTDGTRLLTSRILFNSNFNYMCAFMFSVLCVNKPTEQISIHQCMQWFRWKREKKINWNWKMTRTHTHTGREKREREILTEWKQNAALIKRNILLWLIIILLLLYGVSDREKQEWKANWITIKLEERKKTKPNTN